MIPLNNQLELMLVGFNPEAEPTVIYSANRIARLLLDAAALPPLKSTVITVQRVPASVTSPMYVYAPTELIFVNARENYPFQFVYQFAHELGHLMAQSERRADAVGRHVWIEEALCGAYSIFAIKWLAEHGPLNMQLGAKDYFNNYILKNYVQPAPDASTWFSQNKNAVFLATGLLDSIKPISRLIADRFADGDFIRHNTLLNGIPLNENPKSYLERWADDCGEGDSVARFLLNQFGEFLL